MKKHNDYEIIAAFKYADKKMLVISIRGAACIMPEDDYNRILITERKNKQY